MNLIQITPGAGAMYCGNCFRDNALVSAWRALGHPALMVPLYLPLTLDEADQSADTPIFFSGINVYLEQKSALFRHLPRWVNRLLSSRGLLKAVAKRAAATRPEGLGELTLSMLRGESGRQAREVEELVNWLKTQEPPGLICLSNALLVGMLRTLQRELPAPVVCLLQGEDGFLDALSEPFRTQCWEEMSRRIAEADGLVSPSASFRDYMVHRTGLSPDRVRVLHSGITLAGYHRGKPAGPPDGAPPVLGFFARMCRDKGLDVLVEAYLDLRRRPGTSNLRLKVGGGCGPSDEPLVHALRARLEQAGVAADTEFFPNLARSEKVAFLESLSVFSVPAALNEDFGLYVIEALAAGVPVVQPATASFPEIIADTAGGLLCERTPRSVADRIEELIRNPARRRAMGIAGQAAVFERFSSEAMARNWLEYARGLRRRSHPAEAPITAR